MDSFAQADCCELGGFGPGTRWMIERRGPAAVVPSALSCAIPSSTHLGFRESLQKEDTDLLHLFPPMGAALSLTWELCGLFPPQFFWSFSWSPVYVTWFHVHSVMSNMACWSRGDFLFFFFYICLFTKRPKCCQIILTAMFFSLWLPDVTNQENCQWQQGI